MYAQAVAGISSGSANSGSADSASTTDSSAAATSTDCPPDVTVTVTAGAAATDAAAPAATSAAATGSADAASGNLQKFTGALGGVSAPPVTATGTGGRDFVVTNNDSFVNLAAALGRSCDVQHNQCANAANSGGSFAVSDCDNQNNQCHTLIQ